MSNRMTLDELKEKNAIAYSKADALSEIVEKFWFPMIGSFLVALVCTLVTAFTYSTIFFCFLCMSMGAGLTLIFVIYVLEKKARTLKNNQDTIWDKYYTNL